MRRPNDIGKALIKHLRKPHAPSAKHTTEINLQSAVEYSDIDEFMAVAALANCEFQTERDSKALIAHRTVQPAEPESSYAALQLPRRPQWSQETTAEQLEELEKESFLQWRRSIADTEESHLHKTVTPFEKNIEVWRQLWRVIEKSQIVCQIVDARNPLFFRSPDLEDYIASQGKTFYVLMNKADLVPCGLRALWSQYFESIGIVSIHFSALEGVTQQDVHSRQDLLELFARPEPVTVGFVGYPNVGKSSVLNLLSGKKLTGVAAQPGKTKHFQTTQVTSGLILCDCPGLVFPALVGSKAEMVTCGVLPIDKIKDVIAPVELLCLRIPSAELELGYGVKLGGRVPARVLLDKIALQRGFVTGNGLPDQFKAGKMLLKDYVSGKLVYCHLPPGQSAMLEPEASSQSQEEINADLDFFTAQKGPSLEIDRRGGIVFKGDFKLTKQERRELKFAVQRGEDPARVLSGISSRREKKPFSVK